MNKEGESVLGGKLEPAGGHKFTNKRKVVVERNVDGHESRFTRVHASNTHHAKCGHGSS